jgi:hypothetical protein
MALCDSADALDVHGTSFEQAYNVTRVICESRTVTDSSEDVR